tara:strand:- start:999 stop:2366 length:1368 start_codon:yes stop_codon:yes gene_type:complete
VNLGELLDFCGNLLDYDPVNTTYRAQLVSLLNDAQTRTLTDRPWAFASQDRKLRVYTDTTLSLTFTNGSAQVTGAGLPVSTDPILPGSALAMAELTFDDSGGTSHRYRVAWVELATRLYLRRPYTGASGTYTVTVKRRQVRLPSDCMTLQNVSDPKVGIPAKALFLSKWEREDADLDPDLLGTVEAFLPSEGKRVQAPQVPRGVAIVAGVAQGARTIDVYMCNIRGPAAQNFPTYRKDASSGFESALSKVASYTLTNTQTLTFTPEALANQTGLYRRYYFTCAEANILAPVRVTHADAVDALAVGVDTVAPTGGVTLKPRLGLTHLSGQAFQAEAIRYSFNQAGLYQSVELYPHPSGDQDINTRMIVAPPRMQEDQDVPLVPAAYAQIVAYAALEALTLKVDNPALASVYMRKKDVLFRAMEQRYLKEVPRRIIKGTPTAGYRFVRNPFGPLRFS